MKNDLEVGRYALRTFDRHYDWGDHWGSLPYWSKISPHEHIEQPVILGPLASSVGNQTAWLDGTCTAQCLRAQYGISRKAARRGAFLPAPPQHRAPHRACSCGIYGSLDWTHLERQHFYEVTNIVAVIAAEGATIIGTRGLRTQYARVVGYWTDNEHTSWGVCAKRQFTDAKRYKSVTDLIDDFNIPRTLVPTEPASSTYGHEYWA